MNLFLFILIISLLIISCTFSSASSSSTSISSPSGINLTKDDDDDQDISKDSKLLQKKMFNFASNTAGAVILDKSPASEKGFKNLLNDDKDKYGICSCDEKKWVVIGLSEDILISSIVLANYERYSSTIKDFQLFGSTSYPTNEWIDLGVYQAEPKLGEQTFHLLNNENKIHTRYLKLKWLSHYLDESLCTLSQIKVYGVTVLASLKEEVDLNTNTNRYSNMLLNDIENEVTTEIISESTPEPHPVFESQHEVEIPVVDSENEIEETLIPQEVDKISPQHLNSEMDVETVEFNPEVVKDQEKNIESLDLQTDRIDVDNTSIIENKFSISTDEALSESVADSKTFTEEIIEVKELEATENIKDIQVVSDIPPSVGSVATISETSEVINNEIAPTDSLPEVDEINSETTETQIEIEKDKEPEPEVINIPSPEESQSSVATNSEVELEKPHEVVSNLPPATTSNSSTTSSNTSVANPNCLETLKFNEYRSKMLIKLNNKSSSTTSSDNTDSLLTTHSNDNVFKQLFQKVKQLEIDQAIVEMYLIQITECLKSNDKQIQHNITELNMIKESLSYLSSSSSSTFAPSNIFFSTLSNHFQESFEDIFYDNPVNSEVNPNNNLIVNLLINFKSFILSSVDLLQNVFNQNIELFNKFTSTLKSSDNYQQSNQLDIENILDNVIKFYINIFNSFFFPLLKFNTLILSHIINISIYLTSKSIVIFNLLHEFLLNSDFFSQIKLFCVSLFSNIYTLISKFTINIHKLYFDLLIKYNIENNNFPFITIKEKILSFYQYLVDCNNNILTSHSKEYIINELISSFNTSLIEAASNKSEFQTQISTFLSTYLPVSDNLKNNSQLLLDMNISLFKQQLELLPAFFLSYYYHIYLYFLDNERNGNQYINYTIISALIFSILVLIYLNIKLTLKAIKKISNKLF